MRRVEPVSALSLPPVSAIETTHETSEHMGGSWTVSQRRRQLGYQSSCHASPGRSRRGRTQGRQHGRTARQGGSCPTPRSPRSEHQPVDSSSVDKPPVEGEFADADHVPEKEAQSRPAERQANATKSRSIEGWLNSTLDTKTAEGQQDLAESASGTGARMHGLTQYGIDAAALERLGLDPISTERVHRALFVYSQGLHTVLQDAVGNSKNRSQALLVVWKAFTAVLEHAAASDKSGAGSLAALVQKGNADEMARIEEEYKSKVESLDTEVTKLGAERREKVQEINRLKEDEMRLRNENDMYQNDHEIAMQKYELEIRMRMNAEVKYHEKMRWAQALQEDLSQEKTQSMHLTSQLAEANSAKEALLVEMDELKAQLRTFEAQNQEHQQQSLEATQQKQRYENQFAHFKHNLERANAKMLEMKEQLEAEAEANKNLNEQITNAAREARKLETQLEDESHFRQELQHERDVLRKRLDALDKELMDMMEERRVNQKEISDLRMRQRTDEIELKRLRESVSEMDKKSKKREDEFANLQDTHRTLGVEADYLREDVKNLDEQLKKETELRKSLQLDKKQLQGQLQTMTIERDTAGLAVASTRKELTEVTKKMVKMESVVRQSQAAMQKLELEHAVERKSHAKKVALLEKVISDEREERRNLVAETQEMGEKRQEVLDLLRKKDLEMEDIKRQRLAWEEEADHCRILLKAQQDRNEELVLTVDKHHAAVANHDAEMRQMHVVLQNEREECERQIKDLQSAYQHGRQTMEQRIDMWQMRFEDALSLLHFNPATQKIQTLMNDCRDLQKELKELKIQLEAAQETVKKKEDELVVRQRKIDELKKELKELQSQHRQLLQTHESVVASLERRSMVMTDAQATNTKLNKAMEAFDSEREALEDRIEQLVREKARMQALLNKSKATVAVQVNPRTKTMTQQTDLSYQYLETPEAMAQVGGGNHRSYGPKRCETLDAMKKAGTFVEDPEQHRDFTINIRSSGQNAREMLIPPPRGDPMKPQLIHRIPSDTGQPAPPLSARPRSQGPSSKATGGGAPPGRGTGRSVSRPLGLTPSPWPH